MNPLVLELEGLGDTLGTWLVEDVSRVCSARRASTDKEREVLRAANLVIIARIAELDAEMDADGS